MTALESFRPDPERVWIRHRPRRWPAAGGEWTDLTRADLGRCGPASAELPDVPVRRTDDVVYLPPVEPALEPGRRQLASRWAQDGTPILLQSLPGEPLIEEEGVVQVWDLLPRLLRREAAEGAALPEGSSVIWPLIAGLTDASELQLEGLERLESEGVEVVHAVPLELSAPTRRRLAQGLDEAAFDRLFHSARPSTRSFVAQLLGRGLCPFVPRPLPRGSSRLALRYAAAGQLRLAAHLERVLGRSEESVQRLLRGARWAEREDYDLAALVAEENLAIVEHLDERARSVVTAVVGGESPEVIEVLLREYTALRAK